MKARVLAFAVVLCVTQTPIAAPQSSVLAAGICGCRAQHSFGCRCCIQSCPSYNQCCPDTYCPTYPQYPQPMGMPQEATGNVHDGTVAPYPGPDSGYSGAGVGPSDAGMGSGSGSQGSFGGDQGLLSDAFGTGRGSYGGEAGMIGDFFGVGYALSSVALSQNQRAAAIALAGSDRRFKIADNNSPFPTDRLFFNYHHFANAIERWDLGRGNLDRYTFGVEKTFFNGLWSGEVRVPIVSGLNSDQFPVGNQNLQATEFGNMGFAIKRRLTQGNCVSTAAGLGMIAPTADDARLFDGQGRLFATIRNESFYLQPFVGAYFTPNHQLFSQFVIQADFDASGNTVTGQGATGVLQDQALLFLDWSTGYWLYRDPSRRLSGLAPMVELHYTTTMQDTDTFNPGPYDVQNGVNRVDVLSLTLGLRAEFGRTYLTTAGVVPLRTDSNRFYDFELGVQLTRTF